MDVIITMSCLMIAASILFLTSVYYQQKRDKEYRRQVTEKISKSQRIEEIQNLLAEKKKKGIVLYPLVDEISEGDVKMFYKLKNEDIINLDEILVASQDEDCDYALFLKGLLKYPIYVDKEDYESIIKYLNIVNVDAGTYVYCNGGRTKIKLDGESETEEI